VDVLILGHERRAYEVLRMSITVFEDLCKWLQAKMQFDDTKGMQVEESVAIFLSILWEEMRPTGTHKRGFNTAVKQLPGNDPQAWPFIPPSLNLLMYRIDILFNRHFHRVLDALRLLYNAQVTLATIKSTTNFQHGSNPSSICRSRRTNVRREGDPHYLIDVA
jgi:hypothetical protein